MMHTANPFSAHKDVLEAPIPETDAEKQRLIEELKNRGRSAVQAGVWPDATALYNKALIMALTDTDKAILSSNLSLAQGKMNHWQEAALSAENATKVDPTYTKGWWRLGQAQAALGQYDKAIRALEKALSIEPNNKALSKELIKMKENAKNAPSTATKEKQSLTSPVKKTVIVDKSEAKIASGASSSVEKMEIDPEEAGFTKSDHVKGYKIVNGKKTSYFHNELSDEAKKLIGDIAPKKIDVAPAPEETKIGGTSAWNKAGTWEERDATSWAIENLENKLNNASYILPESSPAPSAVVTVTKTKVTGHASVAAVRGKKRYIYEFSIKVDWRFEHSSVAATGSVEFPDVDGTCIVGEPYEASDFTISHTDVDSVRPLLDTFVHKQGLRDALHASIDKWVQLFKDSY